MKNKSIPQLRRHGLVAFLSGKPAQQGIDLEALARKRGGARLDILEACAVRFYRCGNQRQRYDLSHAGVGVNRGGIPCGRL